MTSRHRVAAVVLTLIVGAIPLFAADASGRWASSFDTPIGRMDYIYTLKTDGVALTGTAESGGGSTELKDGKVDGDTITFVEDLEVMGMHILITYTGTMTSDDEIKFTRVIGDFGTDEIVAKRVK